MQLSIPQRRDPAARFVLLALAGVVIYALFTVATAPASAQADIIILDATPTLPSLPEERPALALISSTPTPALLAEQPVGWIDQGLGALDNAADQFANDQAAQLAAEQANAQYLANVGAQAPHSPRGDVQEPPPAHIGGPIEYPGVGIIVPIEALPPPVAPVVEPSIAVAVPSISAEQAAVIGARDSGGCPAGEIFYPRSGCHLPGSGGEMPGAVSP